jgi:hypothetical protein
LTKELLESLDVLLSINQSFAHGGGGTARDENEEKVLYLI